MRKFRFEILDRKGNLKEEINSVESGTIAHDSGRQIQRGGKIEIRPESFELKGAVLFDGNSDFVDIPIDFSKDNISIEKWVKL